MLDKEIFDKEIGMCRELFQKQKGCNWGKCRDCGVIPFLHKLYKGELVENKEEVKKLKAEILGYE